MGHVVLVPGIIIKQILRHGRDGVLGDGRPKTRVGAQRLEGEDRFHLELLKCIYLLFFAIGTLFNQQNR